EEKPKSPGAFTRSFMDAGSKGDTPAPFDAKLPKAPLPFTAQFGTDSAIFPVAESSIASSFPERAATGTQPPPSSAESFTKMFGSQAPAENQPSNSVSAAEVTRVFDRPARGPLSPPPPTPRSSGFTEMFGSARSSSSVPEARTAPVTPIAAESKPTGFTELFKAQSPSAQLPLGAEA